MVSERRNLIVLSLLAILLVVVVYRLTSPATDTATEVSSVRGVARTAAGRSAIDAPDVHLESLKDQRPKPSDVERNLFRFKPKAVSAPPVKPAPPPTPVSTGPPSPPAVPPIGLKFVAVWEVPGKKTKLAVLSDGRGGAPLYGGEGETVDGRYKILRIGAESVEMSYLDGRGRQTIRLTGQ